MADKIQVLIDKTLDEFISEGHEDFIAHFSYPLPATVIAEIIGAPAEDAWRFRDWSQALAHVAFGSGGDDRDDRYARSMEGLDQMFEYLGGLMELRRREPGEDMISDLLAGADGDTLSDHEIKSMCALMLFAGHETTTSTIASAVLMLLQHPDQMALLASDPDELAGGAVEEALRYEGAIKVLHRWVKSDLELHGREIKDGPAGLGPPGRGQPRSRAVRGSRPVRHHSRAQSAHRVRKGHPRVHRRPALAPRDAPRAGQRREAAARSSLRRAGARASLGAEPRVARPRGAPGRARRRQLGCRIERPFGTAQAHIATEGKAMADSVYRVTEVIGTSSESWEAAARNAVQTAGRSVRDLRVAEVVRQDVTIENGAITSFRVRLAVSFKYETGD